MWTPPGESSFLQGFAAGRDSMRGLILVLAFLLVPVVASAETFTVDAGGTDFYSGDIDGGYVFVGNISIERADDGTPVPLRRTNDGLGPNEVPDDGVDHIVRVEIFPQAYGNGAELVYTNDGFTTTYGAIMTYDGPAGNNDAFSGVIPGTIALQGVHVQYYVRAYGPTAGGNDFEAYVPGAFVNFFFDVAAGPIGDEDETWSKVKEFYR
jgi:hypothetical protein